MNPDKQEIDLAEIASKFINHSDQNVFLTGNAGTGKTTLLKHIVKSTHKKCVIVAPTGIAAINAGGVTIHSLFQLPFGNFVPVNQTNSNHYLKINDPVSVIRNLQMNNSKRNLLQELDLLIIDEVSMLRADLLDVIDLVLRHVRRKSYLPFGGVQVLFIGDLLQLPPVIKNEEWDFLKTFYNSIYFFDANVLKNKKPVYIELDKIYRQTDNDFIELLNNLRNNRVTESNVTLLNNYYKPGFIPTVADNYITLTTHNYKANKLNADFLLGLNTKSYFFEATIASEFSDFNYPVEKSLELKKGAQVMFVKNDPTGAQRYFNGKIGVISELSFEKIAVQFDDNSKPIIVETYIWENVKFSLNTTTNEIEEKIVGTFSQFPIKLAWAITVHKSQGLTFAKAIIDIGDAFAPGQVYVALSRLQSLQGLVLTSPINFKSIEQDVKVTDYAKTKAEQENLSDLIAKESQLFLKSYLLRSFNFDVLVKKVQWHAEGYTKDEKKSAKQRYIKWSIELQEQAQTLQQFSTKFQNQIVQILDKNDPDYLNTLEKRILSAKEYFLPLLKNLSLIIFNHIEIIKTEFKIKAYVKELLELETVFYEQTKKINKSTLLLMAMKSGKEFSGDEIKTIEEDKSRIEQINQLLTITADQIKKGSVKKETVEKTNLNSDSIKSEKKSSKPDTKAESLKLFNEGKTIKEIAILRSLVTGTIETHLVPYVANGEIDIFKLVPRNKVESIAEASKKLDSISLSTIKGELGEEYSYSEIRLALAYCSKEE